MLGRRASRLAPPRPVVVRPARAALPCTLAACTLRPRRAPSSRAPIAHFPPTGTAITPAHYPGGAMLGRRASRLRLLRHPGARRGIPPSLARLPLPCAPDASKMNRRPPSDGLSTPAPVSTIPKIPVNKRICLRTRSP